MPKPDQSNKITRRTVLATGTAALGARALPKIASSVRARHVVTVYYDKALGAMRALDRVIR